MSTQPALHALSMSDVDTTFPTTVPVAGKANYGDPIYKTPQHAWLANIGQEFAIDSFDYSTTSVSITPIYSSAIFPYNMAATVSQLSIPWFVWYVCQFQSWTCAFDLVLQPVKHSAHRGALSVACTLNRPDGENLSSQFLPVQIYDISGDTDSEYVYPIPCVYAFSAKIPIESARNLTSNETERIPKYAFNLTHLTVMPVVPLSSSDMLPPTITFKVILRPKIETLTVNHPVLPSYHRLVGGRITSVWNNV